MVSRGLGLLEGGFTRPPPCYPSAVSFGVPTGTVDMLVVTFSAECELVGSSSDDDWILLEVRLDGEPMPAGSPGKVPYETQTRFCSGGSVGMHSARFCRRVGGGSYTVEAVARLVNNTEVANLTAGHAYWTLLLQVRGFRPARQRRREDESTAAPEGHGSAAPCTHLSRMRPPQPRVLSPPVRPLPGG